MLLQQLLGHGCLRAAECHSCLQQLLQHAYLSSWFTDCLAASRRPLGRLARCYPRGSSRLTAQPVCHGLRPCHVVHRHTMGVRWVAKVKMVPWWCHHPIANSDGCAHTGWQQSVCPHCSTAGMGQLSPLLRTCQAQHTHQVGPSPITTPSHHKQQEACS